MSGQRLGNYLIEEPLGQGGVATVWRARHRFLGTTHALKVISRPSPKALTRLLREGRVQAQLQHPAVVPVTDIVVDDERVALAMPLIAGGTLEGWLRVHGPQPCPAALALFQPILEAIAHAHAAGVLHRDLKPANVLMNGDQPMVADFGIARLLGDEEDPEITRVGAPMGTLGFCAPEQWANASQVDPRADVFSLGALLFYLLSGRAPFDEDSPTSTLRNTLTGRHPDLRRLVPECPERIAQAVHKALLPRPEDRPASAEAFAGLLDLAIQAPTRTAGRSHLVRTERPVAEGLAALNATGVAGRPEAGLVETGGEGAQAQAAPGPTARPQPPPGMVFTSISHSEASEDEGTLGSAPPALVDELVEECRPHRRSLPEAPPTSPVPRTLTLHPGRLAALAGAVGLLLGVGGLVAAAVLRTAEPASGSTSATAPAEDWTATLADLEATDPMGTASPAPAGPTPVASPQPDGDNALAPGTDPSPAAGLSPTGRTAAARSAAPEPSSAARVANTTVADARCPREGSAALGWIALSQRDPPTPGSRVRIRRPTPVQPGRPSPDAAALTGSPRCQLDRGQRVEVRGAAVEGSGGLHFVEVFPSSISGG